MICNNTKELLAEIKKYTINSLKDEKNYRVKNLPATGKFLSDKDSNFEQLILN